MTDAVDRDLALGGLPGPLIHLRNDVSVLDPRQLHARCDHSRTVGGPGRLGMLKAPALLPFSLAVIHIADDTNRDGGQLAAERDGIVGGMCPDEEAPEQRIPATPPAGASGLPSPTPRSRELWETLLRQGGRLGHFYEGALRALGDTSNPVRVEMAAYALRELIEELERAAVASPGTGPKLGDLVERLRSSWEKADRNAQGDGLLDPCDLAVRAVDRFLADADLGEESRRNRAQTTIRELDPARREGPPAVTELRVERLLEFRDEFNGVLHGKEAAAAELEETLRRFERFLLDWFRPQTFADFDAIDTLLEGGPPQ